MILRPVEPYYRIWSYRNSLYTMNCMYTIAMWIFMYLLVKKPLNKKTFIQGRHETCGSYFKTRLHKCVSQDMFSLDLSPILHWAMCRVSCSCTHGQTPSVFETRYVTEPHLARLVICQAPRILLSYLPSTRTVRIYHHTWCSQGYWGSEKSFSSLHDKDFTN